MQRRSPRGQIGAGGLRLARLAAGTALAAAVGICGCSVQQVAVSTMVPVLEVALVEAFAERDIETAREALPSQILLLRGLCRADSDRVEVWTTAVQLYASYALTFIEPEDPERAAVLYREGMELGRIALRRQDWIDVAWSAGPDELRAAIAERAPEELAPLMMWTAACLGKHVLNNLDRPREMADLPYAHVLADAAIELDAGYFYGMPHALKGIVLATTPLGLGGDLEAAEAHFRAASEIAGEDFLFHDMLLARYVYVTGLREDLFEQTLEGILAKSPDLLPEVHLINAIAQEWARDLLSRRDELF